MAVGGNNENKIRKKMIKNIILIELIKMLVLFIKIHKIYKLLTILIKKKEKINVGKIR